MVQHFAVVLISHKWNRKSYQIFGIILGLLILTGMSYSQEPYYFHTIHSHGLSLTGGRTAKMSYMYQASRKRQIRLSGTYTYDSYDIGRNHIKTNIYNVHIMPLQLNLLNKNRFFLHTGVGGGGYYFIARDLIGIKHKEWRFSFVWGLQAQLYLVRNFMALTVDYDIQYMPWSRIYEFFHVPTAGITFFFY